MMSSNDFEEVLDLINDFTGMTDEEVMYDDDLSLRPPIPPPNSVPQQPLLVSTETFNRTTDEDGYVEDYDVSTLLSSFFGSTTYVQPPQPQTNYNPYNYSL